MSDLDMMFMSTDAERYYKEGIAAFKSGDLNAARESLRQTVEIDDQYHNAWNALGVTSSKTGEFENADTCFKKAVAISPDNQIYYKNQQKNVLKIKVSPAPSNLKHRKGKKSGKRSPFVIIVVAIVAIIAGLIILSVVASIIIGSTINIPQETIAHTPVPTLIPSAETTPPPSIISTVIQTPMSTPTVSVMFTPDPIQTVITPSAPLEAITPSPTIAHVSASSTPLSTTNDITKSPDNTTIVSI